MAEETTDFASLYSFSVFTQGNGTRLHPDFFESNLDF